MYSGMVYCSMQAKSICMYMGESSESMCESRESMCEGMSNTTLFSVLTED